jgi:aquaporin Z
MLMVMIYAGGHLSGGHYNPAVTLAALIRHRIGVRDALAYRMSQIGAGLIAALLVRTVIDPTQTAATATLTLTAQPCWRRSSLSCCSPSRSATKY